MKIWPAIAMQLLFCLCKGQEKLPLEFERINGLSQNTVFSITKDRQGFLWITTADGLNRFDGVEMKIYKPSIEHKPGTYVNRMIRSPLVEDELDQIWFSSNAGLYSYNKKKDLFEHRKLEVVPGTGSWTMDPLYSTKNKVWGSNNSLGVFEYDIRSNQWTAYPVKESKSYEMIFSKCIVDQKNNFWALPKKGVLFFDSRLKKWKQFLSEMSFTNIGAGVGCIYLSSNESIFSFDLKSSTLSQIEIRDRSAFFIKTICTDKKGNSWLGDDQGNIFCKEKSRNHFQWRGNINAGSKGGYPVYTLFVDENDILWAGADVLGLLKGSTKPNPFFVYPPANLNTANDELFIHSVCEDGVRVLLGTYQKGLWSLNRETGKITQVYPFGTTHLTPEENSYTIVYYDSKENLWVGSYTSLLVKRKGEEQFSKIPLPRPSLADRTLRPMAVYELNDTLYFSTFWGIYAVYNSGNGIEYFEETGTGFYYDIFIDKQKNYWLATENGIYRKKHLDKLFGQTEEDTLLFRHIGIKSFLADDSSNLLWLSTTSGLIAYHLPTGKYKSFTEAEGLGNSHVYGSLKKGNVLWVSTNKGLSRARIIFTKNEALPSLSFTNYTRRDGLPDDEFNTYAYHAGKTGNFYFGSIKGIVWFKPDQVNHEQQFPELIMTELLINDKKADSLNSPGYITNLSLPYYKNSFLFKFRGIDYINRDHVQYAYQLEGWDKDWIYSGTLNEVRYNNLPAAHYTFKIKASSGGGVWEDKIYKVSIVIAPPFWRTWWFTSLVILASLAFILAFVRYMYQTKVKQKLLELEKQQALHKERQRISREMHDDIGAGLTQIALMSESAKIKSKAPDNKELCDIADTSRMLVDSMSEIIWTINPDNKTLEQFISYLRENLNKQLEYSGINYSVELPDEGQDILLRNEQMRNLLMVTKETVNNAIKHSRAKNISIKFLHQTDKLHIEIKDDGVGFDAQRKYSGNGLHNIRQRTREIGGEMQIASDDRGTRFNYFFPINTTKITS